MRARCSRCEQRRKQTEVASLVAKKGLSVRETEALVRRLQAARAGGDAAAERRRRGTRTSSASSRTWPRSSAPRWRSSRARGGKGKLVVTYNSLDELDGILAHIQ